MPWEKSKDVPSVFECKKDDGYTLLSESINGIQYLSWLRRGAKGPSPAGAALWAVMDPNGVIVSQGLTLSDASDYMAAAASMASKQYRIITKKDEE